MTTVPATFFIDGLEDREPDQVTLQIRTTDDGAELLISGKVAMHVTVGWQDTANLARAFAEIVAHHVNEQFPQGG